VAGLVGEREAAPVAPTGRRLLEVSGLRKEFGGVAAVEGVSFHLDAGESLGLVGESGSGKSTLARLVCRLLDPTAGSIRFEGDEIGAIPAGRFHRSPWRREIQLVFQDHGESLNPRFAAFDCIADPLRRLLGMREGAGLRARVEECAERVGLPGELLGRFPHQLSGGQKARVGIARAIAPGPRLLVLDEPTAALDVSVQAVVLHLLDRLRREAGLAYLFVSHDLNVVRMMCERTIVLQAGRVVEEGRSDALFATPKARYTAELLAAIPHFEPEAEPALG
jgi:peptide/nickel transport system ATP-binding protein